MRLAWLLQALERRGWLDETLIIHCSDHGDRMGDYGGYHKGKPEDGSVRTPWFVRLPGVVAAGHQSDAPVEALDVAATLCAAAGIAEGIESYLPNSPSANWWPHLCGEGDAARDYNYAETKNWRMVCDAEWKYIFYPGNRKERLHHRPSDPDDVINLADSHPEECAKYRLELLARMATNCVAPNSPEIQRKVIQGPVKASLRQSTSHLPLKPSSGLF